MDAALKRRLQARFGERLTAPIHQRHDETEIRIGAGDVPDVVRALHDEAEFGFVLLADLAGVDTGTVMQVVYHLWSEMPTRAACMHNWLLARHSFGK